MEEGVGTGIKNKNNVTGKKVSRNKKLKEVFFQSVTLREHLEKKKNCPHFPIRVHAMTFQFINI